MQNTRYRHWRSRPYRRLLSNYRALKVSAEAAHAHLPPEAIISEADIAAIRASECQLLRSSADDGIECVSTVVAGISAEERLASALAEKEKQHKREMLALEASHSKEQTQMQFDWEALRSIIAADNFRDGQRCRSLGYDVRS